MSCGASAWNPRWGLGRFAEVVRLLESGVEAVVSARKEMPVHAEGGGDFGMPELLGDLEWIRARLDEPRRARVAQSMERCLERQPGLLDRRHPNASAEIRPAERSAVVAGKDKLSGRVRVGERPNMSAEDVSKERREADPGPRPTGLRRAEAQPTIDLDEHLNHVDPASQQINPGHAEAAELAPAQPRVCRRQNQAPIATGHHLR